jgi:hypothetical protein
VGAHVPSLYELCGLALEFNAAGTEASVMVLYDMRGRDSLPIKGEDCEDGMDVDAIMACDWRNVVLV